MYYEIDKFKYNNLMHLICYYLGELSQVLVLLVQAQAKAQ